MLIQRTLLPVRLLTVLISAILILAGCAGDDYDPYYQQGARGAENRTFPGGIVVRKGDNLSTLARRYGVGLPDLIAANRLRAPYRIYPGQKLRLPRTAVHTVRGGETLYGVAERHGVSMMEMAAANGIEPPYRIVPGQKLRMPDAQAAPTQVASADPKGTSVTRSTAPRVVSIGAPPPRSGQRFLWPVRGPVSIGFGPRGGGLHNDGINILARRGAGVRAAANGVVAYSGNAIRGFGNLILIKHADGWMSAYAHNDVLLVKAGQKVRRGETISRVGNTGNVIKPQLHFELRRGRKVVDPVRYLGPPRQAISAVNPAAGRVGRRDPG